MPAFFSVFARTSPKGRQLVCLVQASAGRRVIGATLCARGFHALLLRRRDDRTLVARSFVFFVAPDTRWRLELSLAGANEAQAVATDAVSNRRGVVRSRFELTPVPEDSVFTVRVASERGARCRLRINPGPLSADPTGQSVSPRQLIGHGAGARS